MENDQIDLWDFLKHNFKHMKNCPVGIQKEASVALWQRTLGFSEGTAKNFYSLLFSLFSELIFKSKDILLFYTIIILWLDETSLSCFHHLQTATGFFLQSKCIELACRPKRGGDW